VVIVTGIDGQAAKYLPRHVLQAAKYLPVLGVLRTAAIDHVLEALRGPPQGDTQGRAKPGLDIYSPSDSAVARGRGSPHPDQM